MSANTVPPAAPAWLEAPDDLNRLDPALWPGSAHRDDQGQLHLGGLGVTELTERFASPVYVFDEADFRARAEAFARGFDGWGVYYASKSFLCRAVARWVEQAGLGLDVCSGNELAVGLAAGFPAERIGLHGNNKSEAELIAAIETGVGHVIVDCFEEIERLGRLAGERGRRGRGRERRRGELRRQRGPHDKLRHYKRPRR